MATLAKVLRQPMTYNWEKPDVTRCFFTSTWNHPTATSMISLVEWQL